jgi:bacillithiol system protein YtxJ
MVELRSVEEFEELLSRETAIVFKHSTQCPISAAAHAEMEELAGRRDIYLVKVIESRQVSDAIERITGIRHESPQVIVLCKGKSVWHASHRDVTAEAVEQALA